MGKVTVRIATSDGWRRVTCGRKIGLTSTVELSDKLEGEEEAVDMAYGDVVVKEERLGQCGTLVHSRIRGRIRRMRLAMTSLYVR